MGVHVREKSARQRIWHPLTGALLVAGTAAAALAVAAAQPAWAGASALLALGAVAGFSVSGST